MLGSGVFRFEADINGDGEVNLGDVRPFLELQLALDLLVDGDDILKGGAGSDVISGGTGDDTLFGFRPAVGDVNRDGEVDFFDVSPFVSVCLEQVVFNWKPILMETARSMLRMLHRS